MIETVKLTLHRKVDTRVIELLQSMPYGQKARLIAAAMLMAYRIGADGDIELIAQANVKAPAVEAPKVSDVKPVECSLVVQPEPPKKLKIHVEPF